MKYRSWKVHFLVLCSPLGLAACASVSGMLDTDDSDPPASSSTDDPVPTGSSTEDSDTGSNSLSASESTSDTPSGSGQECELAMAEAFEGGALPQGWTVEDGDSDGYTWEWKNEGNDIGGQAAGGYVVVDATTAVGAALHERLVSLELSNQGCSALQLAFDQSFPQGVDDLATVQISVNGADWQTLHQYDAASTGAQALDLSAVLASDASFRLGFLYEGSNGQYWKLDNVRVIVAQ